MKKSGALLITVLAACGREIEPAACVEGIVSERLLRPRHSARDTIFVIDGALEPVAQARDGARAFVESAHSTGVDYRCIVASAESADVVGLPLGPHLQAGITVASRVEDAARRGGANRVFDAARVALGYARAGVPVSLVVLASRDDASEISAQDLPEVDQVGVLRPKDASPRLGMLAARGVDWDVFELAIGSFQPISRPLSGASFPLSGVPTPGTVGVTIDGKELPREDPRGALVWIYEDGVLSIKALFAPAWDTPVDVSYTACR